MIEFCLKISQQLESEFVFYYWLFFSNMKFISFWIAQYPTEKSVF
jgi:hypothetical protein